MDASASLGALASSGALASWIIRASWAVLSGAVGLSQPAVMTMVNNRINRVEAMKTSGVDRVVSRRSWEDAARDFHPVSPIVYVERLRPHRHGPDRRRNG